MVFGGVRRPSEEALSGAESRRDLRSTEVQRRETVEQSGQEQPQHRVSWHAQEELARKRTSVRVHKCGNARLSCTRTRRLHTHAFISRDQGKSLPSMPTAIPSHAAQGQQHEMVQPRVQYLQTNHASAPSPLSTRRQPGDAQREWIRWIWPT